MFCFSDINAVVVNDSYLEERFTATNAQTSFCALVANQSKTILLCSSKFLFPLLTLLVFTVLDLSYLSSLLVYWRIEVYIFT